MQHEVPNMNPPITSLTGVHLYLHVAACQAEDRRKHNAVNQRLKVKKGENTQNVLLKRFTERAQRLRGVCVHGPAPPYVK